MSFIKINNLSKMYKINNNNIIHVLDNINIVINEGELFTILGPNGCGKTTLLNILANITDYDSGNILIDKKNLLNIRVGYVLQNFPASLLPWRNSYRNIEFPLEIMKIMKEERKKTIDIFLKKFNVKIPLYNYPYQLSGGQQQLISIIRAFIINPDILLMDEPFNGLDYETRIGIYDILLDIWSKTKVTILLISHDIDEALLLSNKVAIMSKKPSKIVEVFENNIPLPRNQNTFESPDFLKMKIKVLKKFKTVF